MDGAHNFGRFWFRLREIIQKWLLYFIISKLTISVNPLGECKSQPSDRSWGYNWKTVVQFESEIMQRAILEERNYNQRISISTLGDSVNQLCACKSRSSERFWDFIGTRPCFDLDPQLSFFRGASCWKQLYFFCLGRLKSHLKALVHRPESNKMYALKRNPSRGELVLQRKQNLMANPHQLLE